MALTFLYRDLDATDTDVTPYVVLRFGQNPQGMAEQAEERSVGAWDLQIEDDGALDLHAQRTFYVLEDDTYDTDNVLWVGQTFDKHSERGDIKRTGAGRVYTLSLIDLNTLLERRVIQSGDDPDRPAETDVERMLWLQGLGYVGVTDDWISTDDPVDMDAVDYTGRMAAEVIEDCSQQSTKNAFMFRDPDADTFALFYGNTSANIDVLTSDIRLSNVLSDIDNVTTFEVNLDANLWEANSRIYSGMFANYDGGAVYVENATTVTNFSHRDTTMSWPDVKSSTKATARATRQLAIIGSQENRITCAVEVPSTQVGLLPHAGWRLQVRFSHFPDFTEFTWMRILSRNTTLIGPNRYRIQYELSPGDAVAPPLACATVVGALQTWDSGAFGGAGTGSSFSSPRSVAPDSPSDYPAVVIAAMMISQQGTGLTYGPVNVTGAFTELDTSRPVNDFPNAVPTAFVEGYKALTSGSPGNFTAAWTPNPCEGYRGLAIVLPTSATAPVQQAHQMGSGGTCTLPSPPTPGNILVLARFAETSPFIGPPTGYTPVISGQLVAAPGVHTLDILVRCVQPGDTALQGTGDTSFSHWAFLSEWALT